MLATLCAELAYGSPLERREALADEAQVIAESSHDDATVVRVLNLVSLSLLVPPLLEQSLARSAEALGRAERLGDPVLWFWAACSRHIVAGCAGDVAEMDRCLEVAKSLAEKLDQPTLRWVHAAQLATRALLAGDTDRAEQLATEALEVGTECGEPDALTFFGTQLIDVSWQRGTMADFIPLLAEAEADNPGLPGFAAGLAIAYAEADQLDHARQYLQAFAAKGFALPLEGAWLTAIADYAGAAIECQDASCAGPLFDQLAPWINQLSFSGTTTEGPVTHYLGGLATVLGRYDDANAYFALAAEFSDRVGAKFFAARTDLLWGKMLAERRAPGDTEKARELLTKAHTVAAAHGYGNVQRRAAAARQLLDS